MPMKQMCLCNLFEDFLEVMDEINSEDEKNERDDGGECGEIRLDDFFLLCSLAEGFRGYDYKVLVYEVEASDCAVARIIWSKTATSIEELLKEDDEILEFSLSKIFWEGKIIEDSKEIEKLIPRVKT